MIGIAMIGSIDKGQDKIIKYELNQMNDFIEDKVFIDFYKGNKLINLLNKEVKIEKMNLWQFDNWTDIEGYIEGKLKKFDKLIIIKTPMIAGMKYNDASMLESFNDAIKSNDKYNINFMMLRRILHQCMLLKVASKINLDVIQFVYDPQEINFADVFDFKSYKRFYILKRGNDKYAPIYEYEMYKESREAKDKGLDLFFIGGILTKDRLFLYDVKQQFEGIKGIKFEVFDKKENKNNRITQTKYYEQLSKAKYTIIIKPYQNDSFSIIRFFEAICNNCIPLILDDVNLAELNDTFPDIYDIIIKYKLIINVKNVQQRISQYEQDKFVINEIVESKSFKKITNYVKVKNFYSKLLEV